MTFGCCDSEDMSTTCGNSRTSGSRREYRCTPSVRSCMTVCSLSQWRRGVNLLSWCADVSEPVGAIEEVNALSNRGDEQSSAFAERDFVARASTSKVLEASFSRHDIGDVSKAPENSAKCNRSTPRYFSYIHRVAFFVNPCMCASGGMTVLRRSMNLCISPNSTGHLRALRPRLPSIER